MKRITYLLLIICLFAACNNGKQYRLQLEELERQNCADSLMMNDSLARDLVKYFDQHGTSNEQLRAYYMLGRTYADRGEIPQAIESYSDAANHADTTDNNCNYKTLARVHTQKAELFYYQLMADKMISEERQAMHYALMAKDTMQYLYCYGMLAEGYEMKNMLDTALSILSDTYLLYKKVHEPELAAGLCCSMADIYRQQKNYILAEKYMKEYETNSGFFLENGDIESGKEIYYSCKGQLCLDTSDKDNAIYYFRKLLWVANNYDLKVAAFDGLQLFYAKHHNKDSLVKYNHLRDSICNIAHNEIEIQKTLQVQAMYDFTRSELKASQKSREAERLWYSLIIITTLSIILILLFTIIYSRHQNEKHQMEDRIRLLSGYAVNENLYNTSTAKRFRHLLKESPYKQPELKDWKELSTLIDQELPLFRETLNSGSQLLSDFEYDVCMLIKIQISASDIAKLKQCTPSYITQTRKNIYKKLFLKKGRADELDEYIMTLS